MVSERDEKGRFVKGNIPWIIGRKGYINSGSFKKGHTINLGRKEDPKIGIKRASIRKKNGTYSITPNIIKQKYTGKTYELIYGHDKAKQIKHKIGLKSLGRIPINKNKTYEELFGDEQAKIRKEYIKMNRARQIIPMKDTQIEIKIQNYLKKLKIEFFTHYYTSEITHSYQCDILIPVQKSSTFFIKKPIIIECDGDYWHGNILKYPNLNEWQKEQVEEDEIRTKELKEKGYNVIRLWENKIIEMNLNQFKEVLQ